MPARSPQRRTAMTAGMSLGFEASWGGWCGRVTTSSGRVRERRGKPATRDHLAASHSTPERRGGAMALVTTLFFIGGKEGAETNDAHSFSTAAIERLCFGGYLGAIRRQSAKVPNRASNLNQRNDSVSSHNRAKSLGSHPVTRRTRAIRLFYSVICDDVVSFEQKGGLETWRFRLTIKSRCRKREIPVGHERYLCKKN